MTEQADLLRMICQHPDDDAPRLIYADWLEEQGDDTYAEFIRVSVRLVQPDVEDMELWRLGVRYRQLEVTLVPRLMADMPRVNGLVWHPIVERGFIARVEFLNPNVLFEEWPTVFDLAPIRFATINRLRAEHLYQAFDVPVLAQLRTLQIAEANIPADRWATLGSLAQLTHLVHLDLSGNTLRNEGITAITRGPAFATLQSLNVADNFITDAGARAFLSGATFRQLKRLYVAGNPISAPMMQELRRRYDFVFAMR